MNKEEVLEHVVNIPAVKKSPFSIELFNGLRIAQGERLAFILGPCALESRDHAMFMVEKITEICFRLGISYIFKSSFDKANRSSIKSYRGLGFYEGLKVLEEVRTTFNVPIITDIHEPPQCEVVADVVDILQIPAFLSRQTDLIVSAAETQKCIAVKKGQFLSPWEMKNVIEKIESVGNEQIILTERGTMFGYQNLVVDFRSLLIMRDFGYPICFDATHSQQLPGQLGDKTGGTPQYISAFVRAATAAGIDVLFMEVHDCPERALSDGTNQLPLNQLENVLRQVLAIRYTIGDRP